MPARIHPGSLILVMDHSVITLHQGGAVSGTETAFLSLYDISYSTEVGAGHVVLVRVPGAGVDAVFADSVELGRRMQARLRGMGTPLEMLERDPIAIDRITRDPLGDQGWFGYRFGAGALEIVARWEDLEPPFFAEGPAPAFSKEQDIWSVFFSARRASIRVNGRAAPGAPFDDDVWVPRLGRSLSSAHSALGETRVTPRGG